MTITVLTADRMTPAHWSAWSILQSGNPALDSPYFRPEFTQAVAAVRNDVEIAVIAQSGAPVAFFPFHRTRGQRGIPIGGLMSDFQGLICREDFTWDPAELIRACGLNRWEFDHLIASQQPLAPYHWFGADSQYIDLSRGFAAYEAQRRSVHCEAIAATRRKARKMQREIGPLRLEPQVSSHRVFDQLLAWKQAQYQRTGRPDVMAMGWTVDLLAQIWLRQEAAFSGTLSALYCGDRLVAAHFGMRCHGVLHAWFPAYDVELAGYSPGLIFWLEMIQAAPAMGITRIDLGKGTTQFKTSFGSAAVPVAEGAVDFRLVSRSIRHAWWSMRYWVRTTPVYPPARRVARIVRSVAARLTRPAITHPCNAVR
jgi:CelD/BcsL family acetyltransferase involved in cellulose biosynthesis